MKKRDIITKIVKISLIILVIPLIIALFTSDSLTQLFLVILSAIIVFVFLLSYANYVIDLFRVNDFFDFLRETLMIFTVFLIGLLSFLPNLFKLWQILYICLLITTLIILSKTKKFLKNKKSLCIIKTKTIYNLLGLITFSILLLINILVGKDLLIILIIIFIEIFYLIDMLFIKKLFNIKKVIKLF